MKIIFLFIAVFAIAVFINCEKTERNLLNDETIKDEIITVKTKEKPPGGIMIRRGFDWKIIIDPNKCEVGKGLCISGFFPPESIENTFYGKLIKHPVSENQLIFFFCDEFIEAEDDIIIDGKFIIDKDVSIDEEMSSIIGIEYPAKIKQGAYLISKNETIWNKVIVDIE